MSFHEEDSIERSPHDAEHPFTMVSNALIRDSNISPACRWLLIYLLSSVDKWKIQVKAVSNHVKDFLGRDSVYKLFDEAIKAGYMKRIEIPGTFPKRYKYQISEFKKFLLCPENQDTDGQDTEKTEHKNTNPKKEQVKESSINQSSLPPPKPEPNSIKVFTWIDRLKEEIRATDEEIKKANEIMKKEEQRTGERKTNPKNYLKAVILDDRERTKEIAAIEQIHNPEEFTPENEEERHQRLMKYLETGSWD